MTAAVTVIARETMGGSIIQKGDHIKLAKACCNHNFHQFRVILK
jgi:hypothetical protein